MDTKGHRPLVVRYTRSGFQVDDQYVGKKIPICSLLSTFVSDEGSLKNPTLHVMVVILLLFHIYPQSKDQIGTTSKDEKVNRNRHLNYKRCFLNNQFYPYN